MGVEDRVIAVRQCMHLVTQTCPWYVV